MPATAFPGVFRCKIQHCSKEHDVATSIRSAWAFIVEGRFSVFGRASSPSYLCEPFMPAFPVRVPPQLFLRFLSYSLPLLRRSLPRGSSHYPLGLKSFFWVALALL